MKLGELFTLKNLVIGAAIVVGAKYIYEEIKDTPTFEKISKDVKKVVKKATDPETMTVESKEFVTYYKLSSYEEVTETGWEVPTGAYNVRTEHRIKNVDHISVGEVSIPIERSDIYYIYDIKKWVHRENIDYRGVGQFGETEKAFQLGDIKSKFPGIMQGAVINPQVGDIKIREVITYFKITGSDNKTGKLVHFEDVDQILYNGTALGDIMDYDMKFGKPRNLRRHIYEKSDATAES